MAEIEFRDIHKSFGEGDARVEALKEFLMSYIQEKWWLLWERVVLENPLF